MKEILDHHGSIPSSFNFRQARPSIEKSKIFQSFLKLPKGGNLHIHSFGHSLFALENGTYRDECYINMGKGTSEYIFGSFLYTTQPPPPSPGIDFKNVNQLRQQSSDISDFDQSIYSLLQFETPPSSIPDKEMWTVFNEKIRRTYTLLNYLPVFKSWLEYSFKKAYEDNLQHLELRKKVSGVYDLDGRVYSIEETLTFIYDMLDQFNRENNASLTLQFIFPSGRGAGVDQIINEMKEIVHLRESGWKDQIVGFDLVDHEDGLNPLIYYLEAFAFIKNYTHKNRFSPLPFYFHAGESTWFNGEADQNLYDAVLLNTTRIGHGFSLKHHPKLRDILTRRNIAIEVSPTSNQLLRFVEDMRNHPASVLLSEGVPVVITTDDPDIFGYDSLAFEYYHVFMSWGVRLNTVKQLSINGIQYSSLPPQEKRRQLAVWNERWGRWIKSMLTNLSCE